MRKGHRRTQSSYVSTSHQTYSTGADPYADDVIGLLKKSEEKIQNKVVTLEKLDPQLNHYLTFGNYTIDKINNKQSEIEHKLNKSEENLGSIPESCGSDSDCEETLPKKDKTLENIEIKKQIMIPSYCQTKGYYSKKQNKSYTQIYQKRAMLEKKKKKMELTSALTRKYK